jgi:hypothetical protein
VTAFSHSPDRRELIERLGAAFADSADPDISTRPDERNDPEPSDEG